MMAADTSLRTAVVVGVRLRLGWRTVISPQSTRPHKPEIGARTDHVYGEIPANKTSIFQRLESRASQSARVPSASLYFFRTWKTARSRLQPVLHSLIQEQIRCKEGRLAQSRVSRKLAYHFGADFWEALVWSKETAPHMLPKGGGSFCAVRRLKNSIQSSINERGGFMTSLMHRVNQYSTQESANLMVVGFLLCS